MKIHTLVAAAAFALAPFMASAATFTFGAGPDGETYSDTVGGITLTASAGLYSGNSITTTDADGLGGRFLAVDSSGIGVRGLFDSNQDIDGNSGNDLLTFFFDQAVNFVSVTFSNVDGNDDFDLFVNGAFEAGEQNIASQNPYSLLGYTGSNISFGADGSRDNFRISSITVEAVPLPAGGLLLLSGLGLMALRRRKS